MGDIYTNPPQSRNEAILRATIDGTEYTAPPQSRIEDLLIELKAAIEQSGGGTTVVANPEGAATDEVKKLQVGSTVYAIEDEAGRQLIDDTVGWKGYNLLDLSLSTPAENISNRTVGGFTVTITNASYGGIITPLKRCEVGKKYKVSLHVDSSNISYARVAIRNASYQVVEYVQFGTTAGDYSFEFTYQVGYMFSIMVTGSTATSGVVTFSNAMIYDADLSDIVFEPYHDTVDSCKADNSVIAPVEDGTTVQKSGGYAVGSHAIRNGAFITWKNAKARGETIADSDYDSGDVASELEYSMSSASLGSSATDLGITFDSTANYVAKCGHIVEFRVRFIVAADIATGSGKAVIQLPYVPLISSSRNMTITKRNAPYEIFDGGVFYIDNLGNMIANDMNFTAGTYDVNGMFICQ